MGAAIQARIPDELSTAVEEYADRNDVSFSHAVRELLQLGLAHAEGWLTTPRAHKLAGQGGAAIQTVRAGSEEVAQALASLFSPAERDEVLEEIRAGAAVVCTVEEIQLR
jgi:hypothetical protein